MLKKSERIHSIENVAHFTPCPTPHSATGPFPKFEIITCPFSDEF